MHNVGYLCTRYPITFPNNYIKINLGWIFPGRKIAVSVGSNNNWKHRVNTHWIIDLTQII